MSAPRSMIGTKNGGPSGVSQEVRDRYAAELEAMGSCWSNTANNIRVGFENIWITPGLKAIERALREGSTGEDE